jgi:hypothetical protein
MAQELVLPDPDDTEFAAAIRVLRDHLLGAVEVDREITLNGLAYVVAWADRRAAEPDMPYFDITSAMGVVERPERAPAIVATGEEQVTLVIDGERFIFHLVAVDRDQRRLSPR